MSLLLTSHIDSISSHFSQFKCIFHLLFIKLVLENSMNKILVIILLLIPLQSYAKNISDFDIERISIGDSALQFINEENLLALQTKSEKNADYKESVFIPNNKEAEYSIISIAYKNDDKEFIIESIEGYIYYKKNFENCLIKKKDIINTVSNLDKEVEWVANNYEDEKIKSYFTYAVFKTGHIMMLYCNDNLDKKDDVLSVYIRTIDYHLWKNN